MKRGGPLRRVSKKRAKRMSDGEPAVGPCELLPYLTGIGGWENCELTSAWYVTFERHHVFRMRHLLDDPRFVLVVSKAAHHWCHWVWDKAGFVCCVYALWHLGRLDLDAVRKEQKCPIFRIQEWLRAGDFESSPIVKNYAATLVREHF